MAPSYVRLNVLIHGRGRFCSHLLICVNLHSSSSCLDCRCRDNVHGFQQFIILFHSATAAVPVAHPYNKHVSQFLITQHTQPNPTATDSRTRNVTPGTDETFLHKNYSIMSFTICLYIFHYLYNYCCNVSNTIYDTYVMKHDCEFT